MMGAVAAGYEKGIADTYARIQVERPEMARAVDRIQAASSYDELASALSDLCDAYDPVFDAIVASDSDNRVALDLYYGGVWHGPAIERAEAIIRAETGRVLGLGEMGDSLHSIEKRDHPGYTAITGGNPKPPRVECQILLFATRSYLDQ